MLKKTSAAASPFPWRKMGVALLAAVALLLISLAAYRHYQRYKKFMVHDPNLVYRSSWLEPHVFADLIKKYKIRTVVNLCDSGEKHERVDSQRLAVEAAGAKLAELSFPPNITSGVDYEVFDETEKLFDDPSAYPIWVHCYHGVKRTAKAMIIYDIRKRGMTARESLSNMPFLDQEPQCPIVVFAHNYEKLHRKRMAEQTKKQNPEAIPR